MVTAGQPVRSLLMHVQPAVRAHLVLEPCAASAPPGCCLLYVWYAYPRGRQCWCSAFRVRLYVRLYHAWLHPCAGVLSQCSLLVPGHDRA